MRRGWLHAALLTGAGQGFPSMWVKALSRGLAVVVVLSLVSAVDAAVDPAPAKAGPASGDGGRAATVAEAREAAADTGEPQVVGSMLSETRTVEVTPSGSFVATEHLRPIRARSAGGWQPIDTTLALEDGVWAPRVSAADVRISAGGDGPLVSMSRAGRQLSLSWGVSGISWVGW